MMPAAYEATASSPEPARPNRAHAPPHDTESLRLAIQDLATTHLRRYPRGAEYLRRLNELDRQRKQLAEHGAAADANELDRVAAAIDELGCEALLANPLLDFDRILVLKRQFPRPADARAALGNELGVGSLNAFTSDTIPRQGVWQDELAALSELRRGVKCQTLYAAPNRQTIIDPDLHFDGDRVLFARQGDREANWRLFEIAVDGQRLRQVSPDDGDDVGHFDPCYLPDGSIIFASTAVYQGLPCTFGAHHMVCLYRLDPGSGSIRQLTFEQDSDWCPTVLADGRVLYLRWEYTDQSHANSRMLFTMNPDGTEQREYRGRDSWFPGSFFHARPIPGHPRQVIGVAGGHHDVPRSGRLLILDPGLGRSDAAGIVQEVPGRGRPVVPLVRDRLIGDHFPQFLMPYPLSEKYFLVAAKPRRDSLWGIYLVDVFDNITLIHEQEGTALLEPIALRAVPKPPVIADRTKPDSDSCTVTIEDVYAGPGLEGVPRGTVKKLRVIEYYFSRRGMGALYGTLGADGPWDVKRILGTVPVADDGSAHFVMPANTSVTLQPLDERGQSLQLMRSWMVGMPGEKVSCIGCHTRPNEAPRARLAAAIQRPPSQITEWNGPPRGFGYVREVQPVLDRYCVSCHGGATPASGNALPDLRGGAMLSDWSTQMSGHWPGGGKFSRSYWELQRFVRRPGIEGDRRMFTPLDYHVSTTELGQLLRKGHHGVALDAQSHERLAAWIDLNAPYYGTWGEIPQFDRGYGTVNHQHLAAVNERALELRRKYVPAGPFVDYEAIPATPPYDATPVAPRSVSEPAGGETSCPDWPFSAAAAVRVQRDTTPSGAEPARTVSIAPPETRAPTAARYVRIEAGPARWLSLAEVQVFVAGRNVALGKQPTQSSTQYGGEALRAVDGVVDGVFAGGSVTHTGDALAEYWELDLLTTLPIERIEIWNRTDTAGDRLSAAEVQFLDAARNVVWRRSLGDRVGDRVTLGNAPAPNLPLAWIPPGEFLMGSTTGHADERPRHRVKVERGFWLGRHEISNAMYRLFDPAHESRTEDRHGYQFGVTGYDLDRPEQPVVRVSWQEATAFCEWLSRRTGRKFVLPTEAQWEWACRAGTESDFSFGDRGADFSSHANFGDAMLANFAGDPYTQDWRAAAMKHPNQYDNWIPQDARFNDGGFISEDVAKYAPNPWGLRNMHGNVWEWTRSAYRPYPHRDDDERDEAMSDVSVERVARGGSWYDRPLRGTSSFRLPYPAYQRVYNLGFRVVCEE
ncbi:MAG: SUMF1/EgtB/PvdO family nonheme iron enzyme [Pirellulales bacterium]